MSTDSPAAQAKAATAPYIESTDAQRDELLQRLEQHRQQIDAALSPARRSTPPGVSAREGGFPRSYTMRLILSEPMLMTAISGIAAKLFGARLLRALPVAAAVAKTVHAALRVEPAPPPGK